MTLDRQKFIKVTYDVASVTIFTLAVILGGLVTLDPSTQGMLCVRRQIIWDS